MSLDYLFALPSVIIMTTFGADRSLGVLNILVRAVRMAPEILVI